MKNVAFCMVVVAPLFKNIAVALWCETILQYDSLQATGLSMYKKTSELISADSCAAVQSQASQNYQHISSVMC